MNPSPSPRALPATTAPDAWRPVFTADGSPTLAHPLHGELCHSDAGAWQQARERYAQGCRLRERAHPGTTLRLLDIGTGLGWNLAAALEAVAGAGGRLEAWSLEHDASVIRAMLFHAEDGSAERERWHAPVRAALAQALDAAERGDHGPRPLPGDGRLELVLGDARETLPRLPDALLFDAVFLDPFSRAVEPELWQPAFLQAVAGRMASGSWLATYSASLPVRLALAEAGLRVGAGPRVGRKREGTLASPDREPPPLDARSARRLARRAESAGRAGSEGRAGSARGE